MNSFLFCHTFERPSSPCPHSVPASMATPDQHDAWRGIWRASSSSSTPTATAGSLPTTTTAAAAERMCAVRGAPPRPHALMHTALPTPPLQRPLLTTCLACLAADRVHFSTTNNSLLFLQTDDVGSAAGEEMVLDVREGPTDDPGCVGTRGAFASGWRTAFGRAVCFALRMEREGPRRGQCVGTP